MKEVKNPAITTLHDLLDYDASKFTNAEIQLRHVLPDWIRLTSNLKLIEVLQKYLALVSLHIENFNKFFETEEISSLSTTNRIMHACIEEINEKITYCTDHEVKDACLLAGIQGINHIKISTYGTGAAFARMLGNEKAAKIFHDAEVNEKQIDDRLTQLAEFEINKKARSPLTLQE